MEKIKKKIEYRLLNDSENSPWQPLTNVNELIWDGVYAVRITGDDGSCGLPFSMGSDDMVSIVVKDYVPDDNVQTNRIIVQTLTRVERVSGSVYTYIRIRRCKNGEHIWGEWNCQNQESTGSALLADGIVTAEKLADDIRNKVENPLRPLFLIAGALYNDTNSPIERTAPWGETVQHLPMHYYINGLGDITEEQMSRIYHAGKLPNRNCYYTYKGMDIRTTLNVSFSGGEISGLDLSGFCANCASIEIISIITCDFYNKAIWANSLSSSFYNCKKLKKIIPVIKTQFLSTASAFSNTFKLCIALEEVYIHQLRFSLSFSDSPKISKESILQAILNAVPTTSITITLHPEAYTRLFDDADIVAALEAQPLVSLASA